MKKKRNKKLTANMHEARRLRIAGMTLNEIGTKMGKTRQGIRYLLMKGDERLPLNMRIGNIILLKHYLENKAKT